MIKIYDGIIPNDLSVLPHIIPITIYDVSATFNYFPDQNTEAVEPGYKFYALALRIQGSHSQPFSMSATMNLVASFSEFLQIAHSQTLNLFPSSSLKAL
jgi:hypothetical protein